MVNSTDQHVVIDHQEILNVNVGVLGHVDSGKTSLVKALSTLLSTAALDKSKQSRERGMTLDLGFSCFFLDLPQHLLHHFPTKTKLQITLVDCPGHASLVRTIIGGAQIIDMVLLVVDAFKGWQAQTTECLVLAEITTAHLVVALNKADLLENNPQKIQEATIPIRQRLQSTRFASAPIVGVSACVGGEKVAALSPDHVDPSSISTPFHNMNETYNMDHLVEILTNTLPPPRRSPTGPFYFSIDHCFPIRGRGTVLTGTVLSGSISANDTVEFPTLGLERKVKSMQMFKRQVPMIQQGDRAGLLCQLDAKLLERGIAASPGAVQLWKGAIVLVRRVPYYTSGPLSCGSKFHISVGHTTVMATVSFWGARELVRYNSSNNESNNLSKTGSGTVSKTTSSSLSTHGKGKLLSTSSLLAGENDITGLPKIPFDFNEDFLQQDFLLERLDEMLNSSNEHEPIENDQQLMQQKQQPVSLLHWALLDFQVPLYCPCHALIIGSKLDTAIDASGSTASCRLAFTGRLIERVDPSIDLARIKLYSPKERRGIISKLGDPHRRADDNKTVRYEVFGSDLFKKETNMKPFIGMKVETETGDIGEIKSSYGTSGKFRVYFPGGTDAREGGTLIMRFKRYTHDPEKTMWQDLSLPVARSGTKIEPEKKKNKKKVEEPGVNRIGEVISLKKDLAANKDTIAIIGGFFAPEVNIKEKAGRKVVIPSTKEIGHIVGPFGKAGKCKVLFEHGISSKIGAKAELQL